MTRDGTIAGDFLVTFFDLFIRKNLDNDDIRLIYVFSVKDISYQRVVKVNRYAKDDLFLFNVNDEWNVILKRDGTKELFVFNLTDTSMENFLVLISSDLKILQEIKFVSGGPVLLVKLFQLHNIGENTQINRTLINLDLIKLLHFLLCNKAQICYELNFEEIKKMFDAIDVGKVLFDSFPDSDAERKLERQLYQKNLSAATAENNDMNFMKNDNLKVSFIGKTDFQLYWNFSGKSNISTFEIVDAYALKASTDADLVSIRKGIVDFIMENLNYKLLLECEQHEVVDNNRQQHLVSNRVDDEIEDIDNESRIAQQPQQPDYNSHCNGQLYNDLSSACKRFAALYHLYYSRKRYTQRKKAISYSRIAKFLTKIDFNSPDLDLLLGKAEKNGISIFLRLAGLKKYANYRILFHDEASAVAMGDAPDRLIWAQTAGGYGREKSRRARPTSYRNYFPERLLKSPPHLGKQAEKVLEGNVDREKLGFSSRIDDSSNNNVELEPNYLNQLKQSHSNKATTTRARRFSALSSSDVNVTPGQFDPMEQGEEVVMLSGLDTDSEPNKEYDKEGNETEVTENREGKGSSALIEETEQEDTSAPTHGIHLKKGDMEKDCTHNQINENENAANEKTIELSNEMVQENGVVRGIGLSKPKIKATRNAMTRQAGTQDGPLATSPETLRNIETGQYGNEEWASMSTSERQVVLLRRLNYQAKQAMLQLSNMAEEQTDNTQEAQDEIAQLNGHSEETSKPSLQQQLSLVLNGESKSLQGVPGIIMKGPDENSFDKNGTKDLSANAETIITNEKLQERLRLVSEDVVSHDSALENINLQKVNGNFTSASCSPTQRKLQVPEIPVHIAASTNSNFSNAKKNNNKNSVNGHKVEVLENGGVKGKRRVLLTSTTFTPIKRKFTVDDKVKRDMEAIRNSYRKEVTLFFNFNSSTAEAFLSEIGQVDVLSLLSSPEVHKNQQQNNNKHGTSSLVAQQYLQHLKQLSKQKFLVDWESLADNDLDYAINELKDRVLNIVKSNNELISENCDSLEQFLKKRSAKLQQMNSKMEMQKMVFNVQAQRLRKEIALLEKEIDEE